MSNKKVSVVIATYNHEKYIRHTLESVLAQKTNFEFEVLVGEDCSSDGTAAIVREYAEKYPDIIVPFIREKNLGMGGNIVDLVMRTTGEYVAFIEGDDYWIDDYKLQKQVDFLDSHPDYIACFGLCQIVDENEVRQPDREQYSPYLKEGGEYTIKDFQNYLMPGQTATSMYRKVGYDSLAAKIQKLEIDPRFLVDMTQILLMLSVGKMYNLGEYLAAYRYMLAADSGSWSSKNDYYSKENVIQYLEGVKMMEKIAKAVDLDLDFDERRKLELKKLENNASQFNKNDYDEILNKIIDDANNKKYLKDLHKKRQIKRVIKKIIRK